MKNKIAVKLFVTRYPIIFKADNTHTIFKTILFVSKLCKAVGIFIYIYNVLKKIDLIKLIFIYIKRLNNKQQINMTEQLDDNGDDNDNDNDTSDCDSDDSYDSDYYEELI